MPLNLNELADHVQDYVERQTGDKVLSVTNEQTFSFLGEEDIVFSVVTEGGSETDWWVVAGSNLTNLYPKSNLPTSDAAFTYHLGAMMRLRETQPVIHDTPPEDVGYDAFICHASEDKDAVARPLAEALKSMGFWVWFDEFSLEVGDSLRQAIDRGLVNSRFGIVVLSNSFFAKNWAQYELNGLTSREMNGRKVILPIWHGVTKEDVLEFSPPLADKVALSTRGQPIETVAKGLRNALVKDGGSS